MDDIRVKVRLKPDRDNYQLFYVDPVTGQNVTRPARTIDSRVAERAAAEWEHEVQTRGPSRRSMSWEEFRIYYEDSHVTIKARHTHGQ